MSERGPEDDDDGGNQRSSLIALAFIVVLGLGTYALVQLLEHNSQIEDCLLSGRKNCAPIDAPVR